MTGDLNQTKFDRVHWALLLVFFEIQNKCSDV